MKRRQFNVKVPTAASITADQQSESKRMTQTAIKICEEIRGVS